MKRFTGIAVAGIAVATLGIVGCAPDATHTFGNRADCPAEDSCYPDYDENGWHIIRGEAPWADEQCTSGLWEGSPDWQREACEGVS